MLHFLTKHFLNATQVKQSSQNPIDQFIEILKQEYKSLKQGVSTKYTSLLYRISLDDIKGIIKWIIQHREYLKELSPTHPIRIGAAKPGKISAYPFPITLHFTMDAAGNVQLVYDPNSKLPRLKKSSIILKTLKEPEVKLGEKPSKQRGQGTQKTVRDTWSFHAATRQLKPSVANVVKGNFALENFYRGKAFYQADNPFILSMHYGAHYVEHGEQGKGCPKAISFAPRAEGDLFDFMNNMNTVKPDLADILWICYAATRGLALFHARGYLHRDIKAENFLFLRNSYGITVYLNDWDYALNREEAELTECESGSPLYMAFDRPLFNELLRCHNEALQELHFFKTEQVIERYFTFNNMPENLLSLFQFYTAAFQSASIDTHIDPVDVYMRWRTDEAVQRLKQQREGHEFEYAIEIILAKHEPIPLNTPNHAKDDTWALCLMLKYLLGSFIEYQHYPDDQSIPQVLNEIDDLMENNLLAVRSQRLSTEELCVALERILKQFINASLSGLSEKEHHFSINKFSTQLDYYKIKMGHSLQPPPPYSHKLSSCSWYKPNNQFNDIEQTVTVLSQANVF